MCTTSFGATSNADDHWQQPLNSSLELVGGARTFYLRGNLAEGKKISGPAS